MYNANKITESDINYTVKWMKRKELYNKIIFLIILLSSISKFYLINNHEMHRLYRKKTI